MQPAMRNVPCNRKTFLLELGVPVVAALFLLLGQFIIEGCSGGGSEAATTKTMQITIRDTLGTPVSGVIVRLDANGPTATTDANGVAIFTGISTGAHDVHMFPPPGYQWESIYQTTASYIQWRLTKNEISYVAFSGTISNLVPGNTLELLLEDAAVGEGFDSYDSTGANTCKIINGASYSCVIQIDGVPAGSQGTFNLWAIERNASFTVVDAVQLQNKANFTITTFASSTAAQLNANPQNIAMNAVKPATSHLLTVQSVTPPAGVTPSYYGVTKPLPGIALMAYSPSFPASFAAYDPFSGTVVWGGAWAIDNSTGSFTWVKLQKSTKGNSISIATTMTSLPAVSAQNAQGAANYSITFTPSKGTGISATLVVLSDRSTGKVLWNMVAPPTATSVTLPSIPTGVTSVLAQGATYKLEVSSIEVSGASYNQIVSGIYDPTFLSYSDLEIAAAIPVAFIR